MADAQREQMSANEDAAGNIHDYSATSLAAIAASKKDFSARLDTLTNTVAADHKDVERGFEVLTGVLRDQKQLAAHDRALVTKQNDAMASDMAKAIVVAITEGEVKAKAVADRSRARLVAAEKSMLVEITNTVEEYADMTFQTIQGHHPKIADNYLSLKAYAVTASDLVTKYIGEGKGKNLSSLGNLLTIIGDMGDVDTKPAEGVVAGGFAPAIFSGAKHNIDNSVSKINGLVNEFTEACGQVRAQWSSGLGKYLLEKLEESMLEKGVLQVDKIDSKSGNWVFLNGHAVGLSNKLNDFEGLAVRMSTYEAQLASLTAGLSGKHASAESVNPIYVPAPKWKGQ